MTFWETFKEVRKLKKSGDTEAFNKLNDEVMSEAKAVSPGWNDYWCSIEKMESMSFIDTIKYIFE